MMKRIARLTAVVGAVICIAPIFVIITGSLMGNAELTALIGPIFDEGEGYAAWRFIPMYPTFQNIIELLLDTPEYYVLFWNSVKVVAVIAIGQILFAVPAAWGLARYRGKLGKVIYTVYIFCMLLPFQVTMVSQYIVLDSMSLINTHLALILPMVFSTFPVFIMYNSFEQVPEEILEAARLDGAGSFRIFLSIGMPMAEDGIVSAMILGFLEYWNMVEQPVVFIKEKSLWTLSVYLPEFHSGNIGSAFAFSLFSMIPALLVFILGRNVLTNGLSIEGGAGNGKVNS